MNGLRRGYTFLSTAPAGISSCRPILAPVSSYPVLTYRFLGLFIFVFGYFSTVLYICLYIFICLNSLPILFLFACLSLRRTRILQLLLIIIAITKLKMMFKNHNNHT